MVKLIKKLYRGYIGSSLFLKNMLIFSIISIIPILVLSVFISNNIAKTLQEKENVQINLYAYNLNSYLDEKYATFYNLIKQTYSNKVTSPEFFYFIEADLSNSSKAYYEYKSKFISHINDFFSSDQDLQDVVLFKRIDSTTFVVSKEFGDNFYKNDNRDSDFQKHLLLSKPTLQIYPSRYSSYNMEILTYSISINLKILGSNANSSILQLDYSPNGFDQAIKHMGVNDEHGTFYIYTSAGEVIYDSSHQYYETVYPGFNNLKDGISSAVIDGKDCVVSTSHENKFGLIVTQIIPKELIFKEINSFNQKIFITTFICIIFVILLTRYSTSKLSKRISAITSAMKMVRIGNLSTKIHTTPSGDEINDIAINFNEMCIDLSEYINKVYIYEIYKKNAEIDALQTQINPHFIYNTLEAIRMSAISQGDTKVSQMIFLLAKMFRNIVKEENVVLIETEISNVELYLNLFRIRFDNKFSYEFELQPSINALGIPKHILQPLIENYVIHGYDLKKDHNHIRITAEEIEGDILIIIMDNGLGIEEDRLNEINELLNSSNSITRTHIGLKNVHERIKLIYGSRYGITIESIPFQGTTITLRIAAKTKKEVSDYV